MSVPARTLSQQIGDTFIECWDTTPVAQWAMIQNLLWEHGYEIVRRVPETGGETPGQEPANEGVQGVAPEDSVFRDMAPSVDVRSMAREMVLQGQLPQAFAQLVMKYKDEPMTGEVINRLSYDATRLVEGLAESFFVKRGRHERYPFDLPAWFRSFE